MSFAYWQISVLFYDNSKKVYHLWTFDIQAAKWHMVCLYSFYHVMYAFSLSIFLTNDIYIFLRKKYLCLKQGSVYFSLNISFANRAIEYSPHLFFLSNRVWAFLYFVLFYIWNISISMYIYYFSYFYLRVIASNLWYKEKRGIVPIFSFILYAMGAIIFKKSYLPGLQMFYIIILDSFY